MNRTIEAFVNYSDLPERTKKLTDFFASSNSIGHRFLLGQNDHSRALSKVINIDGFIDDFSSNSTWEEKPVVKGENVPSDAIVVNCVLMARSRKAFRRAKELRTQGVLDYAELLRAFPEWVPTPDFLKETRSDFEVNKARWNSVFSNLADEQSKQVLNDVLRFRLNGDSQYLSRYSFIPKKQYFDNLLPLSGMETFVDAGGYDGDTTEQFCTRCLEYSEVFFFEPSPENLAKAKARLANRQSIHFVEKGVSDAPGTLRFDPKDGSSSSINDEGSEEIVVTTMDKEVDTKVTFIKMDLEGWELKALMGSKLHITKDHPKLAIAVYHHPSHFWKVYQYIMSIRTDYKVYLRHYTEGWTETIMYFVPA